MIAQRWFFLSLLIRNVLCLKAHFTREQSKIYAPSSWNYSGFIKVFQMKEKKNESSRKVALSKLNLFNFERAKQSEINYSICEIDLYIIYTASNHLPRVLPELLIEFLINCFTRFFEAFHSSRWKYMKFLLFIICESFWLREISAWKEKRENELGADSLCGIVLKGSEFLREELRAIYRGVYKSVKRRRDR